MDRRIAASLWAAAALFTSCAREAPSRQESASSSQALAAPERALEVKLNGFVIDPRRGEPKVPAELDVPSGKVQVVERSPGEKDTLPPPATVAPGRKSADAGKLEKWIVQFTGPIDAAEKQQLVDLGARIGDYLPDYAFVVAMDGKVRREVEGLPFVNGVVRYKPAFKVDQRLKDEKGAVRVRDAKVTKLQVRVDAPEGLAALISEVHRQKGKVLRADGDVAAVEVRPSAIARLAQLEEVVWLEEAAEVRLQNDTARWTIQTNVNGSTRIWDHGLHGENQIVGVADTGLDHDMCFFRDPTGAAIGPAHRKVVGYVAATDDYDGNAGHGTHVAGTLAGDQTPVTGQSAGNGMAPKARLFITDLAPGDESIVHPPTDLGAVFQAAYDAGARLHSDSFASSGNEYGVMSWSADRFMWDHKDFLAFFANGDAGPGPGTVGNPAASKNGVSVGATENGASADALAYSSSNGTTSDGRIKPTVTAPGVGIVSADSDGVKNSDNCGTVAMSGTSMATPAVAGAAALVRQYYAQGFWPSGRATAADAFAPSAALVKATLVNSAQGATGAYTDGPIPSTGQGWGRVNLSNALRFAGDARFLEVVDDDRGLATRRTWTRTFFTTGGGPLKVTLVWTDHPASTAATKALVNDLDLSVTAPAGAATYFGNVFENGVSVEGGTADRRNVEEQVLIPNAARGTYTVTVTGHNVPFGPQPFALVVTGAGGVTSAGFINLDRTRYNGSSTVEVRVGDKDLNANPAVAEELTVSIRSGTEPAGEPVRLVETGVDTGLFVGSINTGAGSPQANGSLQVGQVGAGETITATYQDASDGNGVPATVTATAVVDLTPPVISNVRTVLVGQSSATIEFTTNEPTTARIHVTGLGTPFSEAWLETNHLTQLSDLAEGRTYRFAVEAYDEAGNVGADDNGGSRFEFTTAVGPPELSAFSSNGLETYAADTVVFGQAVDPSGVASVTVNGQSATYRASDGYFELSEPLVVGPNVFTVVATDARGNGATKSLTVTRLQHPDLVLTSVAGPASGASGALVHVENTVCNVGVGEAPWSGWLTWYLSVDEVISPDDIAVLTYATYGDAIAPGQCVSIPADVRIPDSPSLVGNTYTLGGHVDAFDQVTEGNETNNVLAGNRIAIGPPAPASDIALTAVTGPARVGTATEHDVSVTVANTGNNVLPGFGGAVYLSPDATITTSDPVIGEWSVGAMQPGESRTVVVRVTIPGNVAPGAHTLGAIADPKDEVRETDEANNVVAGNAVLVDGPDLFVTAVTGPAMALSGDTVALHATVAAIATGGGASGFTVGFYLSTDPVITSSDLQVATASVSGLAPGATIVVDASAVVPATLASGSYWVGAIADPADQVVETDENNNALNGGQLSIGGPDLVMTSVTAPSSGFTASAITVETTVTANAAGGVTPGFFVGVFLSTDATITASDRLLGYRWVDPLQPGQSSAAPLTVTLPGDLASGTYHLGAIADNFGVWVSDEEGSWVVENVAKEANEANNTRYAGPIAITGPDLSVVELSAPATLSSGGTFAVHDTVRSTGGGATGVVVAYYLSSDAVITTSDYSLGSRTINLAPGASSTADTQLSLPVGFAQGSYTIGAIVDPSGRIPEGNEGNNSLAGNAVAVAGPDLVMSAVSGPTTALTATSFDVSTTVTNNGPGTSGGQYVEIYVSGDATITRSDVFLAQRYVGPLAAGESSTATTTVKIPSSVASGTYYLGAIADAGAHNAEPDENNNARTGNAIAVTGPDLVMSAVSAPVEAKTGVALPVTTTVAASASGGGASPFLVRIYLSSDPEITTSDLYLGVRSVNGLAPGASSTVETVVTVPVTLAAGPYFVGAIVDPDNGVTESDETNNALRGNAITVVGPDLVAVSVGYTTSGFTQGTVVVENTVAASATGGGAPGFYVGIFLSTDPVITAADTLISTRWVPGLQPGQSSTEATPVMLPGNISGAYYIGIIADNFPLWFDDGEESWVVENTVPESDDSNNTVVGPEIGISGPDLAMTEVSAPATVGTGLPLTVHNTVTASGGGAGAFQIRFFLSTDAIITTSDTYLGERSVSWVGPGAASTADTTFTVPFNLAPGNYYVGAIADFYNTVVELNESNNVLASNGTVTVAGPDLVISSVSGPASAGTATNIDVATTVTNNGPGASGNHYVSIYLSSDATITTSDVYLGQRYVGAVLAAGQSSTATTTVSIPSSVGTGTYYVGAIADTNGWVTEGNENNNARTGNTLSVVGPDLTLTSLSAPASGRTGGSVTVTTTVAASAAGGGASGFRVGIYLSADPVISTDDVQLNTRYVGTLAAGASSTGDTVVTLPTSLAGGTYYLYAKADYTNVVSESDETNNASAISAIAIIGPDLIATSVGYAPAGFTYGTVVVDNTVTASASGGAAGGFYVGIYLSTDPVITSADMLIGTRYVSGLEPGQSSAQATPVTLPNLAWGTYYIGIIADNFPLWFEDYEESWVVENSVWESDDSNNTAVGPEINISGPDLTMAEVSAPAVAATGQPIAVHAAVTATGGGVGAFYVRYYLSRDAVITTSDTYLGQRWVSWAAPGVPTPVDATFTVPSYLAAGQYYVGAIADASNSVVELNEGNNAGAGNVVTVQGPDLATTTVSGPSTAPTATSVPVTVTITNAGPGTSASSSVNVYLSTDAAITSSDRMIGWRTIDPLAPGASTTVTVSVSIPSSVAGGPYYFGAVADPSNAIAEPNENDNALAGNAVSVVGPDLVMSAVSGPASALTGASITVGTTVTASAAGGGANAFHVAIYLSADPVITTEDVLLGYRYVGGVGPAGSSTGSTAVPIPTWVASGTYYLGAIADFAGAVAESDETNNTFVGNAITIVGPDLVPVSVSGPPSASAGSVITVSDTVQASVSGAAASQFYVGIYLSTDPIITPSDLLLGYRYVGGVQPGAASSASTAVTIPSYVASGTYYLGIIADNFPIWFDDGYESWLVENVVNESDETNNALTGPAILIGTQVGG